MERNKGEMKGIKKKKNNEIRGTRKATTNRNNKNKK